METRYRLRLWRWAWRRRVVLITYLIALGIPASYVMRNIYPPRLALAIAFALICGGLIFEYLPLIAREETPMETRYRLRLFDGQYELLDDQHHEVVLDLGLPGYEGILEGRRRGMVAIARGEGEHVSRARLEVRDLHTGERVMDWAGYGPC